jgi:hypothetical protein
MWDKQSSKKETSNLAFAGMIGFGYGWLAFFLHYNFSFTSFWYFYIYIPLCALLVLIFSKLLEEKLFILFIAIGTVLYLGFDASLVSKLQVYIFSMELALYWISTALIIVIVLRFRTCINELTKVATIMVSIFAILLQFGMPSLLVAYQDSAKQISKELLKDEVVYNEILSGLNPTFGKVATWYEADPSGYRGSIISSSSFHLIRLEGPEMSSNPLKGDYWISKTGRLPECLVLITSINWDKANELVNFPKFQLVGQEMLSNSANKVVTYCSSGERP